MFIPGLTSPYDRIRFAPDGEGGGGGDGGGAGGDGGKGAANGGGQGGGDGGGAAVTRPDYIPEKFWDAETNQPRIEDAFKSYGELQRLIGKRAEDLTTEDYQAIVHAREDQIRQEIEEAIRGELAKGRPEKPEDYKLELPAEIAKDLPEHMRDVSGLDGDPLLDWWRGHAHETGLSQEQFASGIASFLKIMEQVDVENVKAQKAALGEAADGRIHAVDLWLQKNLEADEYEAIANAATDAGVIRALERLMRRGQGPVVEDGDGTGAASGVKSKDELKAMMNDKRYWHPTHRDPAYIAEVQREYERAFPGKRRIAPINPTSAA